MPAFVHLERCLVGTFRGTVAGRLRARYTELTWPVSPSWFITPSMNDQYDAWLLDLDGTLYRPGPVKRMMTLELLVSGWPVIQTLRRFRQEHEILRETLNDPVDDPFTLQIGNTADAVGRSPQSVLRTVQEWMIERPLKWIRRNTRHALVSKVKDYKAAGGKLAVVSDYPASRKLQSVLNMPEVDVVVANGEPGGPPRLKPHPDGYLEAARRLGVSPERCLVIGDRDDADGEAARRAGMAFSLVR